MIPIPFGYLEADTGISPNTLIGGVGATYSTEALLAALMSGVSAGDITNFAVDGSNNISCDVNASYTLVADAFLDDTDLTYYHDLSGRCTLLGNKCFHHTVTTSIFTTFTLPAVVTCNTLAFYNSAVIEYNLPACTTVGTEFGAFNEDLTTINMPLLLNAKITFADSCPALTNISLPIATTIGDSAFKDIGATSIDLPEVTSVDRRAFFNNSQLTTLTMPKLATVIGATGQLARTGVTEFYFPLLTSIAGSTCFEVSTSCDLIYMPLCTTLGATTGDDSIFLSCKTGLVVVVDPSLETVNGGNPDGDLDYVTGTLSGTVIYSANQTAPSEVDDLALVTAYGTALTVDWTAPASTNTILFYRVFVDGVKDQDVTGLTANIVGLSTSTSYDITIIVYDDQYNRSIVSNTLTQSTNAGFTLPTADRLSYWNFNTDSTDQVGTNDGTDTSMSYTAGLISNAANFTASTSAQIELADDNTLSFGNGSTDVPFSVGLWVNFSTVTNATMLVKRTNSSTLREYWWVYNSGFLLLYLYDESTNGWIGQKFAITPSTSTWYHWAFTYDGSSTAAGIKMYNQGIAQTLVDNSSGSYVAMENQTEVVKIGKNSHNANLSLNGLMDEYLIYDVELTDVQISEIHGAGVAGTPIS